MDRAVKMEAVRTLGVALGVIGLAILGAGLVQRSLPLGERRDVIPGLLVLTHVRNTGAAYGLLAGERWLLVATAAVVALVLPLVLRVMLSARRWAILRPVLVGLLLGAAVFNLSERALSGYVTDYLTMPPLPIFRVFNLADVAISAAIVGAVLVSLLGDAPRDQRTEEHRAGDEHGML